MNVWCERQAITRSACFNVCSNGENRTRHLMAGHNAGNTRRQPLAPAAQVRTADAARINAQDNAARRRHWVGTLLQFECANTRLNSNFHQNQLLEEARPSSLRTRIRSERLSLSQTEMRTVGIRSIEDSLERPAQARK